MQVIGIDLGSNTLRVIKYDCSLDKKVAEYEKIVRTAQSITIDGRVDKRAVDAIVDGLIEAQERLDFHGCKIKAVTTEALRVAKNSEEVLKEIEQKTAIKFEVISPKDEALLTLQAVQKRLERLGIKRDFVLVDIGGGSTEVTFFVENRVYSKSFQLGIVTVANRAKDLDEISKIISLESKDIVEFVKDYNSRDLEFVATAGTPTTVAAMKLGLTYKTYNSELINGVTLEVDELEIYLDKLLNMSKEDREITVGVGRDDLIVAGILIFKEIYRILDKKRSIVIDDGLREGVALSLCE